MCSPSSIPTRAAHGLAIICTVLLGWLVLVAPAQGEVPLGKGSFTFTDQHGNADRPIQIWTYRPDGYRHDSPIVFVMHGTLRNGETYREPWIPIADRHHCLIVVPEFATKHYPGTRMYQFGNVQTADGKPVAESKWTFSTLEQLFDHVKKEAGSTRDSYFLFGHSAGAQFVHRMVLFKPNVRIARAVTANAGSYTMPSFETLMPYGLDKSGVTEAQLRKALGVPMTVLLGEKDTDPNDKYLPRDPAAQKQGQHRLERGQNFYRAAQTETKRLNVALKWTLEIVPDVGHDNAKMAPAVARAFFAPLNEKADLVLLGGKVVTVDPKRPVAEAVAVRGDKIVAVGSSKEMVALIGDATRVIKLQGRLAIPGFIEGHGHFVGLGQAKMMLDLRAAKTWDEIVKQVEGAVRTAKPGDWIVGRGWHQEKWERKPEPHVNGYPLHAALSRVSPGNPVLLTHASGHMCFANAEAMRLAGVTASTKPPPGGEIPRDQDGNPIGVFRETAQGLVTRQHALAQRTRTSEERGKDLLKAIELAGEECLRKGVTSFQDAGASFGTIDVFRKLAEQGKLPVRLWVMARDDNAILTQRLADYRVIGAGNHHLTVRAIKRSIDGALGPHGAWLLEPYDDLPGSSGLNTSTVESIRETSRLALKHDYQLCVHAIGDRANRETLNLFEEAFRSSPSKESRRWRVEHAQHLHPNDIPRFAKLGVIASMQGIHCTSDAVYVLPRLGLRRSEQGAYVWRSLLDSGALVTNGTDTPVEDVDPLDSFYASVTRKLPSGTAFFPKQCMTRDEALRSYTRDCAFAAFEEATKGTLTPGKLADIVVLSGDILTCPDTEIRKAKVVYTIVGGKVLYAGEQPEGWESDMPQAFSRSGAVVLLLLCGSGKVPADALERLKPERLEAVRRDVQALRAEWQPRARSGPYTEYRANLHVHSHLSHDSRGTIANLVAAAKTAGTQILMFTEHPASNYDYFKHGHRGLKDGMLLIPGAEMRGFLVYPPRSLRGVDGGSSQEFADLVRGRGGLMFLSHLEERMTWEIHGLTGVEIYNTHADVKDEKNLMAALRNPLWLWRSADLFRKYPQEALSALQDYPADYLRRWDELCQHAPHTGIAANDSHQNVGIVLRLTEGDKVQVEDALGKKLIELPVGLVPGAEELRKGKQAGEVLSRLQLDPYENSLRHVGTHLLLTELNTKAVWEALTAGRVFVAFDWLADATGFDFAAFVEKRRHEMGSKVDFAEGLRLEAKAPLPARWKVVRNGKVVYEAAGRALEYAVKEPGNYRVEAWLRIAEEERTWILSNPVYVRGR